MIYYFENRDGATEIRRIEIDEYGSISGGLGFFEHNLEKILDYLNTPA